MKINEGDVEYVAKLAMLEVADDEKVELASQLSAIVEYVEKLNELNVTDIEPTAQVVRAFDEILRGIQQPEG